jgi:ABC-type glycerol-3-phosphate transport system permease component
VNLSFSSSLSIAAATSIVTFVLAVVGAYASGRKRSGVSPSWILVQLLVVGFTVGAIAPIFLTRSSGSDVWAACYGGAYATMGVAQLLGLYVLRNFIATLPRELFDGATMDGASRFQQLLHIVVPRLGPVAGVLGTFFLLAFWSQALVGSELLQAQSGNAVPVAGPSALNLCQFISMPAVLVLILFSLRNSLRELARTALNQC